MSALGTAMANTVGAMRTAVCPTIVWGGKTYPANIVILSHESVSSLAGALGVNVANSDFHAVRISPSAKAGDGSLFSAATQPKEGDTLTLSTQPGFTYIVGDTESPSVGGVTHTITLIVYRRPPLGSETVAPAGETNAGSVKVYDRAQNPL